MIQPIKQEPIDNSPEMKSPNIELPPDINSNTIGTPPHIKSETIEHSPEISPSKRLKTLIPNSQSTPSKGKSIVKEDDDDSMQQQQLGTCGVCLLEEGMSLRGFIDSCEHYFCFVCIMEWAKIESLCPICKRRFSTIRRPIKDGVFLSERIVNVPVRNQIYNHNGNATIGPHDPYSQVKCSCCSCSSDDHLLLLCDLCDSAAHSYCVGLGNTVPEGDWFCKDCTLSRDEHAKVETDSTSDNDRYNNNYYYRPSSSNTGQFTSSDVSICDIVRESSVREPDASFGLTSVNESGSVGERSKTQSSVDGSNVSNARTLQRCLNVHSRIRVLRENWDGFRGGSLSFSSSVDDGIKTSQSQSTSINHESTQNCSYDIDRAWKMMGIAAKALGKKPGNNSLVSKGSEIHKKKERLLNEASKVRPNSNYVGGLRKNESELSSSRLLNEASKVRPNSNYVGGLRKNESELSSSRKIIVSKVKNSHYNCQNLSTASNAVGSSYQSSSIAIDERGAKKAIDATLEKKESIKKDTQVDANIKEIEDAKSEIQSLVKLNLKLLSRDKKLEVDVFKEVARHATHSIMAACGIEPPKARFRSFERLVCDHSQARKRPSSTLMPTCCRECFFVFVKDVVTTIAVDRTTSCKA